MSTVDHPIPHDDENREYLEAFCWADGACPDCCIASDSRKNPGKGIYQHVNPEHLRRYLWEYGCRYNSREIINKEGIKLALKGISSKRLICHASKVAL